MKTSKYFLPLIAAVIFVFILIEVFTYQQNQTPPPPVVNISVKPTLTPQLQTYKNGQLGIEFQYPNSLNVVGEPFENYLLALSNSPNNQSNTPLPGISVIYFNHADDYKDQLIKDVVYDGSGLSPKSFNEFKPVKIGSNNFYYIKTGLFEGVLSLRYYLVTSNYVFKFELVSSPVDWTNPKFDPQSDPLHLKLKQILASVKLIPNDSTEDLSCGGFAGKDCPQGYICQLTDNYPDAGGTCIKEGCVAQGQQGNYFNKQACCSGLQERACTTSKPPCAAVKNGCFICLNCGNQICDPNENKCNCPEDCQK